MKKGEDVKWRIIVTAIAKYHMTEIARTILNDSFDIHAGRAIQDGPMNYHMQLTILYRSGATVACHWVPGHVGVSGNEREDLHTDM